MTGHPDDGHTGRGHGHETPGHGHETPGPAGRFDGAQIPDQPFADDDGSTPPAVAAALATWRASRDLRGVVVALLDARLLVGLVAMLDSTDPAGAEKDSHMAAAVIERPDGRRALVAFTSTAGMAAWYAEARPLPVSAVDAARAAIDDGADALLIDGECALTGAYLWALAEGRQPVPPADDPAVRGAIAAEVTSVLGSAGLATTCVITHGETIEDVVVLLAPEVVAHRDALAALAQTLAAEPVLRSRLPRGLALGVTPFVTAAGSPAAGE